MVFGDVHNTTLDIPNTALDLELQKPWVGSSDESRALNLPTYSGVGKLNRLGRHRLSHDHWGYDQDDTLSLISTAASPLCDSERDKQLSLSRTLSEFSRTLSTNSESVLENFEELSFKELSFKELSFKEPAPALESDLEPQLKSEDHDEVSSQEIGSEQSTALGPPPTSPYPLLKHACPPLPAETGEVIQPRFSPLEGRPYLQRRHLLTEMGARFFVTFGIGVLSKAVMFATLGGIKAALLPGLVFGGVMGVAAGAAMGAVAGTAAGVIVAVYQALRAAQKTWLEVELFNERVDAANENLTKAAAANKKLLKGYMRVSVTQMEVEDKDSSSLLSPNKSESANNSEPKPIDHLHIQFFMSASKPPVRPDSERFLTDLRNNAADRWLTVKTGVTQSITKITQTIDATAVQAAEHFDNHTGWNVGKTLDLAVKTKNSIIIPLLRRVIIPNANTLITDVTERVQKQAERVQMQAKILLQNAVKSSSEILGQTILGRNGFNNLRSTANGLLPQQASDCFQQLKQTISNKLSNWEKDYPRVRTFLDLLHSAIKDGLWDDARGGIEGHTSHASEAVSGVVSEAVSNHVSEDHDHIFDIVDNIAEIDDAPHIGKFIFKRILEAVANSQLKLLFDEEHTKMRLHEMEEVLGAEQPHKMEEVLGAEDVDTLKDTAPTQTKSASMHSDCGNPIDPDVAMLQTVKIVADAAGCRYRDFEY